MASRSSRSRNILQPKTFLLVVAALCINTLQQLGKVQAAPIKVTLDTLRNCTNGSIAGRPAICCPGAEIDLTNVPPVVDFIPKRDRLGGHRVRKALQCLSGEELEVYTQKLTKAYDLMRALPPSDPRSLHQQGIIHCAYGTGSFVQDGLSAVNNFTIDIHFSWLFLPWHRMFVYFHERILQKLLDDPTFTLHFWNFDNGLDGTKSYSAQGHNEGCFKPGHLFPEIYNNISSSTFEPDRSNRTLVPGIPVDLAFPVPAPLPDNAPPVPAEEAVPRNREVMHKAMERGNVSRHFFGITFKYGDPRPEPLVGGGSLEFFPHNSMHTWVGGLMRVPPTATFDPIFYPAHENIERDYGMCG
ncbi:hypothetical protein R1flu_020804 [Riccia fluitans]|uniref:Tyrosinase copper-binding domain-containing protein n=1 Tax=Riccia fluitans TaxID=41844 RepID=A0ABD1ZP60_9MARC